MANTILWDNLDRELGFMAKSFPGIAGIAVKPLIGNAFISINGDEIFPTASTIKIHVLTQLLRKAEKGVFNLNDVLDIRKHPLVQGSLITSSLEGPVSLSILNLAILMILVSDNLATNICIDLAGIAETNTMIRSLGLPKTTLSRKMQDKASIRKNNENISTPNECITFLELLKQGQPSPTVAERCISILTKPKTGPLNRAIPNVPISNKPGTMGRVACDVGIVNLDNYPYYIAIMTKFGMLEALEQTQFLVDVAKTVHQTMQVIAQTNEFGLAM
ncbi:serine hydrolase [SAR202 cluster bacterium AC-409-J13_OGT_754m]|nr:serine hydrolase [SAR202 cluster bacterium AC-409-J13_OGT_754m]